MPTSKEKLQLIIEARNQFSSVMGQASASVRGLGSRIISLQGLFVGLAGAAGIGMVTKAIVDLGVEFQHTMTSVKVISGATQKQFKELENSARLMGKTTEFSASQSAGALRFLAMAGLDVQQQIGALPRMLNLATAANMDLARAADISTNIMTQMGLEVEELTRVNDALVGVQNTSNTTVDEAAQAFVFAGTKATSFGVDVEELTAMIGLLANAGIKGTLAGTTIAQSMLRLLNPSKDAAGILKKYGIQVTDTAGELRSFTTIIGEMADAQISTIEIAKLFGSRASNIEIVMRGGSKTLKGFTQNIRDMKGVAKESAEEMRTTFQNLFKEINSIMEENKIKTFKALEPTLDVMIEDIKEIAKSIGEWVDANDKLIAQNVQGTISGIKDAIGDIVDIFDSLPDGVVGAAGVGLVGAMLFGKKAGAVIAMITASKSAIGDVQEVLKNMTTEVQDNLPMATKVMLEFWDVVLNKGQNIGRLERQRRGSLDLGDIQDTGAAPSAVLGTSGQADLSQFAGIGTAVTDMFPDAQLGGGDSLVKKILGSPAETENAIEEFKSGLEDIDTATLDWKLTTLEHLGIPEEDTKGVLKKILLGEDPAEVSEDLEAWQEILNQWGDGVTSWSEAVGENITAIFDTVSKGIGDSVASAIVDGQSLGKSLESLWKSVVKSVISGMIKVGVQRLILSLVNQGAAKKEAMTEITSKAGSIYATVFNALAAIPIVGPAVAAIGAPIITAAAVGTAIATGQLHGGIDSVPREGTFLLDGGERVIKANQNRDLTAFLAGEGGGGAGGDGMTLNMSILPNATNIDAMLSMSEDAWTDIVQDKIFPAMETLKTRGIEPSV